jgi:steroid 5-alpha reductase family enzyme
VYRSFTVIPSERSESRDLHHANRHPVEAMRIVMMVTGVLLFFIGCVWILQGINVLPGSFMTGQTKWAVIGAITVIVGIVLVVLARRGAPS